jgi:hypothetical protein
LKELVRIWEARPAGKGKLHLIFVGVADRDYSVVRPHRASHPLPFLDDLPVGLKDALADGERLATPVCEFCDLSVDWSINAEADSTGQAFSCSAPTLAPILAALSVTCTAKRLQIAECPHAWIIKERCGLRQFRLPESLEAPWKPLGRASATT